MIDQELCCPHLLRGTQIVMPLSVVKKYHYLQHNLVDAITNEADHLDKISKQLNKVEIINKRLDGLDKLFLNFDKIAEKEKGGRVYLKKRD